MKEWEYKIVDLPKNDGGVFEGSHIPAPTEDSLNELGKDGWELAMSLPVRDGKVSGSGYVSLPTKIVFKRPKE